MDFVFHRAGGAGAKVFFGFFRIGVKPIGKRQILHKFVENVRIARLRTCLKDNRCIIPTSYAIDPICDQPLNSPFCKFEICNNFR